MTLCPECQAPVLHKDRPGRPSKYCSAACRLSAKVYLNKLSRPDRPYVPHITACVICKIPITQARTGGRVKEYCTPACKAKAKYKRLYSHYAGPEITTKD